VSRTTNRAQSEAEEVADATKDAASKTRRNAAATAANVEQSAKTE
jgi:hypothetical protein